MDGQSFVLRTHQDLKSRTWRDLARSFWRYGISPGRLRYLVSTMLPQFQNLCGAYETLQRNLSQTLDNLGLTAERKQSAERYLSTKGISTDFPRDVVQATARARFAHDLSDLNGLAALVAMNQLMTTFYSP